MSKKTERLHESPRDTRERSYERCREAGIPAGNARRIAEDAARHTHDIAEKRK